MSNKCYTSSYSSTSDTSSSEECSNRANKPERIKGPWSAEEDRVLTRLVDQHGPRNWSLISRYIKGRSGKSCRLRWCNQLSPSVEHRPFSPEEDDAIIAAHAKYGNRWATIARLLPGRTDNAVKNHWNSTLRRRAGEAAFKEKMEVEMPQEDEALTTLTLAPPGMGVVGGGRGGGCGCGGGGSGEMPAGFWDAMRDVIAREVREYVNSTLGETSNSRDNVTTGNTTSEFQFYFN